MPLSYSQLSTYQTCPRQYEFASVKKIPRSISAGESFGSSVHNALKKWGELEVRSQREEGQSEQIALFVSDEADAQPLTRELLLELWHQSFIVEGYSTRKEADAARQRGEKLMEQFYEWWTERERHVLGVEQSFTLSIQEVRAGFPACDRDPPSRDGQSMMIAGRFDRIERTEHGIEVIDFKTGSPRPQSIVDEDFQLSVYALAIEQVYEQPCHQLTLLFLSETGVVPLRTTRTAAQLDAARKRISTLGAGITAHDFAPTPSEHACRHCPYRNVCDAAI